MSEEYPAGKISYIQADSHLVIGVERHHLMPRKYLFTFRQKLEELKGLTAQMEGVAPENPEKTEALEGRVEILAQKAMRSGIFEAFTMLNPSGKPLSKILTAYQMPDELLELYLAIAHAYKKEWATGEARLGKAQIRKALQGKQNTAQFPNNFPNIDPERGAVNYARLMEELEGGQTAMHLFYKGCDEFVNAVMHYAIIGPEISDFVGRVDGNIGVLVGMEHQGAAVQVLTGKKIGKPKKWSNHIDVDSEETGAMMPVPYASAIEAVKKVLESKRKSGIMDGLNIIRRGFTTVISKFSGSQ
jgi:hypothetical protein